jgi:dienelactone hydrolase
VARYELIIETGDKPYAGTNAKVFVRITGSQGITPEVRVPSRGHPFLRGKTSKFTLTLPDVGDVIKVHVRHDNSGSNPGWLVHYVTVRSLDTNRWYHCPGNLWLAHGVVAADFWVHRPTPVLGASPFRFGILHAFIPTLPGTVLSADKAPVNAAIYYPVSSLEESSSMAPAAGRFPILVFGHAKRFSDEHSPGDPYAADFDRYRLLLSFLAAWGFVVIAPDYHRVVTQPDDASSMLLAAALFLIKQNSLNGAPFHDHILADHIGFIGHSTGGVNAVTAITDGRFSSAKKALALIAPAGADEVVDKVRAMKDTPTLVLIGGQDTGDFGADGAPPIYFQNAPIPKQCVLIPGANHFHYTDDIDVPPSGDGAATISRPLQIAVAHIFLTVFFQTFLKNQRWQGNYLWNRLGVENIDNSLFTLSQSSPGVGPDA